MPPPQHQLLLLLLSSVAVASTTPHCHTLIIHSTYMHILRMHCPVNGHAPHPTSSPVASACALECIDPASCRQLALASTRHQCLHSTAPCSTAHCWAGYYWQFPRLFAATSAATTNNCNSHYSMLIPCSNHKPAHTSAHKANRC